MARIDPFGGKRAEPLVETKSFTDPRYEGAVLTLTLKGLENDEGGIVADLMEQLGAQWLPPGDAYGDNARAYYGIEYVEFPHVAGKPVQISKTLLQNAANIYTMQQKQGREEVYQPEEIIALSVTWPKAYREICAWAADLNRRAAALEGNASGATGETA